MCTIPEPADAAAPDAPERTAFDLAVAVSACASDLDVIVLWPARGEPGVATVGRVAVHSLPAVWGGDYGEAASWDLLDPVGRADVVHIHELTTRWGECALLAAGAWATPVCATDHGVGTSSLARAVGADRIVTLIEPPDPAQLASEAAKVAELFRRLGTR